MSRDEIEQLQLERLQAVMNRVHKNVVHYRKTFDEAGIIAEDIRSLSDLVKIPFTTKEDLRLNYPYGMFAVPLKKLYAFILLQERRANLSWLDTQKMTLRTWSNLVARFMTAAGVTRDDLVQIAFDYGILQCFWYASRRGGNRRVRNPYGYEGIPKSKS